ncbi:hypothetical protein K1719_025948 [Acacia pycnantha]|nr:hypothetical protein K1719_025948 [Acacia pycnantha]
MLLHFNPTVAKFAQFKYSLIFEQKKSKPQKEEERDLGTYLAIDQSLNSTKGGGKPATTINSLPLSKIACSSEHLRLRGTMVLMEWQLKVGSSPTTKNAR